jgi:hypothetical protein
VVPTGSLLWSPHGPHVLHPWSPLGPHLVHTWSPPGRHASPVRGPCGNHVGDPVVTRWTRCGPGGYQAGTTWGPRVDQVAGHHLVPTWIQLRPHLVPSPPAWFSPGPHVVSSWFHVVPTRPLPTRPHLGPTWSPPRPHNDWDHVVPTVVPTGSPPGPSWSPCGPHMVPTWCPPGPHLVPTWSPPGHHLVATRLPCGDRVGTMLGIQW